MSITGEELIVRVLGLHRLWGFKRRIRVPLSHVRGATWDPGVIDEPRGVRAPGLGLPGITIGTYFREREKFFWDVVGSRRAVVIELSDEDYDRLIVDVEDPRATVDAINRTVVG